MCAEPVSDYLIHKLGRPFFFDMVLNVNVTQKFFDMKVIPDDVTWFTGVESRNSGQASRSTNDISQLEKEHT